MTDENKKPEGFDYPEGKDEDTFKEEQLEQAVEQEEADYYDYWED
jgi:hypothetical protein